MISIAYWTRSCGNTMQASAHALNFDNLDEIQCSTAVHVNFINHILKQLFFITDLQSMRTAERKITCNSASVAFCPNDRNIVPSSFSPILPSPDRSLSWRSVSGCCKVSPGKKNKSNSWLASHDRLSQLCYSNRHHITYNKENIPLHSSTCSSVMRSSTLIGKRPNYSNTRASCETKT